MKCLEGGGRRSLTMQEVDVQDMSLYTGTFMPEANGVRVYVFCYSLGYVVIYTDRPLVVRSRVRRHIYMWPPFGAECGGKQPNLLVDRDRPECRPISNLTQLDPYSCSPLPV